MAMLRQGLALLIQLKALLIRLDGNGGIVFVFQVTQVFTGGLDGGEQQKGGGWQELALFWAVL